MPELDVSGERDDDDGYWHPHEYAPVLGSHKSSATLPPGQEHNGHPLEWDPLLLLDEEEPEHAKRNANATPMMILMEDGRRCRPTVAFLFGDHTLAGVTMPSGKRFFSHM